MNDFYRNKNKIKNKLNNEKNKKRNIKVGLCIMGKEENVYAKEYINHYKKLGYVVIYYTI